MSSGSASWRRVYQRALAMDGSEIADRLRQQATARLDFVRYKAGADFAPRLRMAVSGVQARFFFLPGFVPSLCAKLRQLFPETADQIIERAERIREHRFDLLGYDPVDYGPEIDWHCDRVHAKCAPRKPWFRVKYLDFAKVGDSKVTWELNRHQHLVTLAKAFRLSGNQKFAEELFRQWEHWHAENPYPIGINWASSLEVAFRSLSWLWTYFLLADSPAMPITFRSAWLRSLAVSGRHIDCYLSTYFSPNTHLLGEAVALFFIGTLCPEIPAAPRWRQRGWEIVQQEARRQVRSDGLHFEQSMYYHVYALDFFLHAAVLASVNQIAVPKEFDQTLQRMLDVLAILGRSGTVPRLGDDDGGRLFDPTRNQTKHLLDPLATGTVLFARGEFKAIAGGPREETLWLLGEDGINEFERIPAIAPTNDSVAFQASGLYMMVGRHPQTQLVIDAGSQGAHTAGHGHADALSVTATASGHDLLIDSGTLQYVGEDTDRDRFRGSKAHNTLSVGGRDQAEPRGPFAWQRLPNVQAEGWIAGKTFDLFVGSHDGYCRLPNSVVHRRFVFSLKSGFWLVRDLVLGFGEYQLDLFWHLGEELRACHGQDDCFGAGGAGLRFVTLENNGWTRRVEEQPDSPVYGKRGKHNALHFAARTALPTEFVTIILPLTGDGTSEHKLTRIATAQSASSSVVGYRYQAGRDEHCMFFGQGKAWKADGWSTDAEFLYCARGGEAIAPALISCSATYVEWEQRRILTAKRPVLRCEIIGCEIRGGQGLEVVSTDQDAIAMDSEAWKMLATHSGRQLTVKLT